MKWLFFIEQKWQIKGVIYLFILFYIYVQACICISESMQMYLPWMKQFVVAWESILSFFFFFYFIIGYFLFIILSQGFRVSIAA